jgi:hypothetical protein
MFSYFFRSEPISKTRLDSTQQLSSLLPLLKALYSKDKELEKVTQDEQHVQADSADVKNFVIAGIVRHVNKLIDDFNRAPKQSSQNLELLAGFLLVKRLKRVIFAALKAHHDVLNDKRSISKEVASGVVDAVAVTTIVAAGLLTGSIFIAGATYLVGAPVASKAREAAGLDDVRSASVKILEDLIAELDKLIGTYFFIVRKLPYEKDAEQLIPLQCSLTQKQIENPVRCDLNKIIYEKSAIEDYLAANRKTPFNNPVPMNRNQTIASVLNPISLIDAFEIFGRREDQQSIIFLDDEKQAIASLVLRASQ